MTYELPEKMLVKLICAWNHHKCFEYFVDLYKFSFRSGNPFYRVWHIIKNTWITKRYEEIEKNGCLWK